MNKNELTLFSTCIKALAGLPNADEQIQNLLETFIKTTNSAQTVPDEKTSSIQTIPSFKKAAKRRRGRPALNKNTFKLSTKEILTMPRKIQKLFALDDKLISYRFHKGVFEVQYRRNGLNIYVSASDFQEMKRKFIQAISLAEPIEKEPTSTRHLKGSTSLPNPAFSNILFVDYVNQWLSTKKVTVKESTYAEYERLCEKNLKVTFSDTPIIENAGKD